MAEAARRIARLPPARRRRATKKKRPSPQPGRSAWKRRVETRPRQPRSTTQRAEIRLTRLACHGGHSDGSYWVRACAPPACAGLFGPRLRGDLRLGAAAGSHHSRSLVTAVTGLLVPITAFVGHGSTPGDAGLQRNSLETKTSNLAVRGRDLGPERRAPASESRQPS